MSIGIKDLSVLLRLMAAMWAAVYQLKTIIIDRRESRIVNGHADGLQSRTLEILHSFGFGDQIYKEASLMQEVCFWVCLGRQRFAVGRY
jgi:phenol 2-monooxygenase (NADPH)